MSPAAPRGGDTTGLAIRRAAAASGYGIRNFAVGQTLCPGSSRPAANRRGEGPALSEEAPPAEIRPFGRIVAGAIPGGLQRWKGSCRDQFLGLFDSSSQLGGARLSPGTAPPFSPNSSRRPSSCRTGLRDLKAATVQPSVVPKDDRGGVANARPVSANSRPFVVPHLFE